MNEEQVYLTDSERDYFQKWESMFESDGWQLLVEELEQELADLPKRAFEDAQDWDQVLAGRAAERKLRELLSYPNQIELRKQHLLIERQYEADDEAERNRPDV